MRCKSAGIEQTFKCGKWLALDEGDRIIERTLYESSRKKKEKSKILSMLKKVSMIKILSMIKLNMKHWLYDDVWKHFHVMNLVDW